MSDLTKDDFDSSKFYQNMDESDKMDQDSANAVRAAHARLFGTENEGDKLIEIIILNIFIQGLQRNGLETEDV